MHTIAGDKRIDRIFFYGDYRMSIAGNIANKGERFIVLFGIFE